MRRCSRHLALAALVPLGLMLAGCGSNFDPTDAFDFFSTETRLPGHREEVFPGGVPGVQQGIPPNLVEGHQTADQQPQGPVPTAIDPETGKSESVAVHELQHETKPKRKKRHVARTKPKAPPSRSTQHRESASAASPATSVQWPDPHQQQQTSKVQWPDPHQSATQQPTSAVQWPAPPPPGTFSKQ